MTRVITDADSAADLAGLPRPSEATQALPRPYEECDHLTPAGSFCAECTIDKLILERDALAVRVRELIGALDCVILTCQCLHHKKSEEHGYLTPCPVEARIRAVLNNAESKP